jgi:hypothetical protein
MNTCERGASGEIELYFYGELDGREHEAVERHVKGCGECRRALDDLFTIRAALSTRPVIAAPPDGDWTRFMTKLDAAIQIERETERVVPFAVPSPAKRRFRYTTALEVAAILALATMSIAYVIRDGSTDRARNTGTTASVQTPSVQPTLDPVPPRPTIAAEATPSPDAAFTALSEQHFERSKLVVLGLANKDARQARGADWEFERQLASSLLSDTRLYRLAAEDRGYTSLAKVMSDLELVLLQTASSEQPVSGDLQQIQRLIAKRNLVTRMEVVAAAGL